MGAPILEERAQQARALLLVLAVNCPDANHFYAHPGVPCFAPSEEFPFGWVCLPRMEREVAARASIDGNRRKDAARLRTEQRRERRAINDARQRAKAAARVAAATTTPKENS